MGVCPYARVVIFARHDTFIDGRVLNGEGSVEVLRSTDARKGRFEADRAEREVLRGDGAVGQGVVQRGLADVGHADQADLLSEKREG